MNPFNLLSQHKTSTLTGGHDMLKSMLGFLVLVVLALLGLSNNSRRELAFGSVASLGSHTPEENVSLELSHSLSGHVVRLEARVMLESADLSCENVVWYATRKDAFYLGLEPDLTGCAGEAELAEGEWDIHAVHIHGTLTVDKTLSVSVSK